ncbi:hypothetical protein GCM10012288_12640 [Malaciobacter pacificus]|uniref:Uncharacterized protein n=1 Tax=Malaciobacter pacificus TaxID=1080223 RepID=A0A5C2HA68_9BACT|nr:hypothetical protein [Malaciobacter pacificus]QEP34056.1 hypothetical protein APAC_0919 [Malaciobacter pacificus]GGD40075.1 hypothetical protein GCM10012288_12640 [Malaciobacter pacificus]
MAFNPDDFFITTKVKDILEKFPHLKENDYTKVSLEDELTKLNFEIISRDYDNLAYKNIEDYYELEIDSII